MANPAKAITETLTIASFSVPPIVRALVTQAAAAYLVFHATAGSGTALPALALGSGLLAAAFGHLFRLAPWWLPVNVAFPCALLFGSRLDADPRWFLGAFLVLVAVYWSTFRTQVPLYLSNRRAIEIVRSLLPRDSAFRFIDIGCGTGSVLAPLSRRLPSGSFRGVEVAPLPFVAARIRAWMSGNAFAVTRSDFWEMDLGQYDVVYAFLSPVPMARLWEKASGEMPPGSILVSNTFLVPGVPPDATFPTGSRGRAIYVWRMGAARKPGGGAA